MIRSTPTLLEAAAEFDDTDELAGALEEIAEDDSIQSPSMIYFLKESAIHMRAMHSALMESTRALKAMERK